MSDLTSNLGGSMEANEILRKHRQRMGVRYWSRLLSPTNMAVLNYYKSDALRTQLCEDQQGFIGLTSLLGGFNGLECVFRRFRPSNPTQSGRLQGRIDAGEPRGLMETRLLECGLLERSAPGVRR